MNCLNRNRIIVIETRNLQPQLRNISGKPTRCIVRVVIVLYNNTGCNVISVIHMCFICHINFQLCTLCFFAIVNIYLNRAHWHVQLLKFHDDLVFASDSHRSAGFINGTFPTGNRGTGRKKCFLFISTGQQTIRWKLKQRQFQNGGNDDHSSKEPQGSTFFSPANDFRRKK